jgi:phosphotransferase system enzyme I (PtsI)
MERTNGKSIFKKVAIGKIFYYEKNKAEVKKYKVENVQSEIERFEGAKEIAKTQLEVLYEKAKAEVGEAEAEIFDVHMMMLDDEDYCDSVVSMISLQEVNAEYAVTKAGNDFADMLSEIDDEYLRSRAIDVKDISEQVVSILLGVDTEATELPEPVIMVADDLTPSETVQMDRTKLLGFITKYGTTNSHTAILARTMSIPALIEVDIQKEWHGKLAILDGYNGTVIIEPNEEELQKAQEVCERDLRKLELLKNLKGKESITKDGYKVKLFGNIGSVADTDAVLINDGEGIGLFRSEFLYLESKDYPTEEEQFQAYKTVAESMAGKEVVIRTLDIGADKQVNYFNLDEEENPALGYRAIRICLKQPDIFKTQLRAILRAATYGNILIMLPMIISVSELMQAKEIIAEVKYELEEQGIPYGDTQIGVMIETPAAVMITEELAKEADFFSVGTNDLTQYTLAIDRQNPQLDDFYDPHHPAILRMIQTTVENGHKNGIWVGICGELAADLELTETFLRMGVDELSVSAPFILPLREKVRSIDLSIE